MSNMEKRSFTMEEMVSYCNQYGFIYQGSEIYGGLANTWDYGPLGTRLKLRSSREITFFPARAPGTRQLLLTSFLGVPVRTKKP